MFEAGARVRTRAKRFGHTRLPGYLQQRSGRVVHVLGAFRFADEAAVLRQRLLDAARPLVRSEQ